MTTPNETPAAARRIFFIGALGAVDRQLKHLQAERERITWELDRAKAELLTAAAPPAEKAPGPQKN